tara:strand:- start:197 stop:949 length:753 start_codon:yes stop_codon:yes gene_type:complete
MKKILITGMSGLIGGLLRQHLEKVGDYKLVALNRRNLDGIQCYQADISNLEDIRPAFKNIDVVVHLAANLNQNSWKEQLNDNIIGTYNVYLAAVESGVKRVVFASSGSTIRGFDNIPPYDAVNEGRYGDVTGKVKKISHEVFRPDSIYGATKVWGEAIGRYFSDTFNLSVICIRIGSVNGNDRPSNPREVSAYLSHKDVALILHKCIEAPSEIKCDTFFALSDNKWGIRDLEHSKAILGWEPKDSSDKFL